MRAPASRLWLVPLGLLVVAAGYELAVALGALRVGPAPGAERGGRSAVFAAAELALVAAAIGLLVGAGAAARATAALVALPLAAALFLLARFFSFDAYYAPGQRRMSDDGLVSLGLVVALVGACVGVALLLPRRPRIGAVLTAPVLLLVAGTALAAGAGH
jgi:hypothetical protein